MAVRLAALAVCLLAALPAKAAPLRLRLGWEDMQAVASHAEISPRIVVRAGPEGKERVKGQLAGITDAGIVIEKPGNRRFVHRAAIRLVPRSEVHTVRLMPVKGERFKGHPFGWRKIASVAAVPVGIGAYVVGLSFPHGIPEGRHWENITTGALAAVAAPWALYRLAWRADRRNGAIFIELDHGRQIWNGRRRGKGNESDHAIRNRFGSRRAAAGRDGTGYVADRQRPNGER